MRVAASLTAATKDRTQVGLTLLSNARMLSGEVPMEEKSFLDVHLHAFNLSHCAARATSGKIESFVHAPAADKIRIVKEEAAK